MKKAGQQTAITPHHNSPWPSHTASQGGTPSADSTPVGGFGASMDLGAFGPYIFQHPLLKISAYDNESR